MGPQAEHLHIPGTTVWCTSRTWNAKGYKHGIKSKQLFFFFFKLINWRVLHCNSINRLWTRDTILHQTSWPTLVQVMTCCLLGAKPLAQPMLTDYQLGPEEHNWLDNVCKMPFVQASMCSIHCAIFRWLGARLQYLQCISNGDIAVLHWVIHF